MNYQRQYELLMEKARVRGAVVGYKERHHIVPRCMGGSNKKENLVDLTAREHFVAHRLLWMRHRTPQMAHAWQAMTRRSSTQERIINARDYQRIREAISSAGVTEETRKRMSGKIRTQEHCKNISKARKGIVFSQEHLKNMSEVRKGKPLREETKKKMSESQKRRPMTEKWRLQLAAAQKSRVYITRSN